MEKYPTLCCSAFRSCVRSTFSSSSSSVRCLTLFRALWYSRSWFWKKGDKIRPTEQEMWAESDVKPSTYSDGRHSAVETVEASPGDGAGVEVEQLAVNGGEGHLDALQILQQKQDTAITHCKGNRAISTGPFLGFPSLFPQDTDLHISRCPGHSPQGSHTGACRHRTASQSAHWSKCTPQCAGHRSLLCTHTLPSLITGKWDHLVLLPPQREGKDWFYSSCVRLNLCLLPTCHCWGLP